MSKLVESSIRSTVAFLSRGRLKMISAEQKKLNIQLGVCRRMVKEVKSYEDEVTENEATLQKMRDDKR